MKLESALISTTVEINEFNFLRKMYAASILLIASPFPLDGSGNGC